MKIPKYPVWEKSHIWLWSCIDSDLLLETQVYLKWTIGTWFVMRPPRPWVTNYHFRYLGMVSYLLIKSQTDRAGRPAWQPGRPHFHIYPWCSLCILHVPQKKIELFARGKHPTSWLSEPRGALTKEYGRNIYLNWKYSILSYSVKQVTVHTSPITKRIRWHGPTCF